MNSHSQKEQKKIKEVTGFKRMCKRLFSGSKLDEKLIESVLSGNIDEVKKLINEGANVNARDGAKTTILMLSCDLEYFDLVIHLINKNANIDASNEFGYTALHFAVRRFDSRIVNLIVNSDDEKVGQRVNKQDENGDTPLHVAVDNGNAKIVEFLLKRKANKIIKNKEGLTAIELARKKGYAEIISLLR